MSIPAVLAGLKPGACVYLPDPNRNLDRQLQALVTGKSPRLAGWRFSTSRAVAVHLRGGVSVPVLCITREE